MNGHGCVPVKTYKNRFGLELTRGRSLADPDLFSSWFCKLPTRAGLSPWTQSSLPTGYLVVLGYRGQQEGDLQDATVCSFCLHHMCCCCLFGFIDMARANTVTISRVVVGEDFPRW